MSPRDRPSHAAMAAGAVAAGVASHLVLKRLMKTYRTKGLTKLSLLPSENTSLIRGSAATSTVTFFTGDYRLAATQLTARIEQIVAANPWLDSFLEDGSPLAAFYPAGKKIFSVRGDIELRRVSASTCFSEYDEMVHAVQAVLCKTTDESVGNREPVFKVTLIPAPDDDDDDDESHALPCYALVVSANHSIMDGHGFYKLYAMLSEDEPIVQLNPVRNTEVPKRMVAAMGGEKSLMQVRVPLFTLVYGLCSHVYLCRPPQLDSSLASSLEPFATPSTRRPRQRAFWSTKSSSRRRRRPPLSQAAFRSCQPTTSSFPRSATRSGATWR